MALNERPLRVARTALDALVIAAALYQIGALLWVWAQRVDYPYDLEWMEGATLISALRVRQGLPLYGVPDATYIPFIYPPLYAWVVAGLSAVFPFGYTLARSVSIAGTLAAAGALVYGAREAGARWALALGSAALFLGSWAETGTFFDLVRIDGLSIGLTAWSLVLAAGRTPRRAIAGGVLLAVAFACKHHAALFGFPVVLALWQRDGRAQALRFALAALVPALAFVGAMQLGTDGRFLLWLVGVPSNHGIVANRFFPAFEVTSWWPLRTKATGAMMECVSAMPLVWAAAVPAAFAVWAADVRAAGLGRWALVVAGVAAALGAAGHAAIRLVPVLDTELGAFGVEGVWLVAAAGAALTVSARLLLRRSALSHGPRFGYYAGVSAAALFVVSLMRGHVGGFTNVLIPMMWVQALWPALLARRATGLWGLALTALVGVQIVRGMDDARKEIPTAADRAQGDALIAELRALPDPLLIPDAPYYAVLAGHEPSFALITLWDISDAAVPEAAGVDVVRRLIRERHWASAVFPDGGKVEESIGRAYRKARPLAHPGPATRTGWAVRLKSVWERKGEGAATGAK